LGENRISGLKTHSRQFAVSRRGLETTGASKVSFLRDLLEIHLSAWQAVPANQWKIPAVHQLIEQAHSAGKNSTLHTPIGRHDFMHNKVLVIDDT
jgi:phosphatidylserine/phosphatidylglycerophosphate/cardiolipin synthase-like enzyme